MENKFKLVVNDSIIMKLGSISQDIKTYVNTNIAIANGDPQNVFPRMKQEDVDDLMEIRSRIKKLNARLANYK